MTFGDLSFHPGLLTSVRDALRRAITTGQLKPGERLVQERLAEMFGVSREPIRQALRVLEAEGLILHRPRRGSIVAPLAAETVRDVYEVRAALESLGAHRAAGRLTNEQRVRGKALLGRAQRALERGDVPTLLVEDRAFHRLILEASGNSIMLDLFDAQWNRVQAVMRAVLESGYAERAWTEHAAIFQAVAEGDAYRAEALARAHDLAAAAMLVERLPAFNREAEDGRSPEPPLTEADGDIVDAALPDQIAEAPLAASDGERGEATP